MGLKEHDINNRKNKQVLPSMDEYFIRMIQKDSTIVVWQVMWSIIVHNPKEAPSTKQKITKGTRKWRIVQRQDGNEHLTLTKGMLEGAHFTTGTYALHTSFKSPWKSI